MDAIAAAIVEPGKSFPLGAELVAGGANFSVFSKHASAVELLLFDRADDARPPIGVEVNSGGQAVGRIAPIRLAQSHSVPFDRMLRDPGDAALHDQCVLGSPRVCHSGAR